MARSLDNGKTAKSGFVSGKVCLIGAGPGDAELLTLKAVRRLMQAEIVFYDRLVSDDIIDLVSEGASLVPVGKSKGDHSVPQHKIHEKLVAAAKAGLKVVRLKGGDPYIFGRGGEEVDALRAENIEVEVIPGISSALGCAASAQIPLTHRDHAQAVTFVTGHAKLGEEPDLDWQSLARSNQTVVIFMGVGSAPRIVERLLKAGRGSDTPIAIIENGTRLNEKTVHGHLSQAVSLLEANDIAGPALLIIGEVAALGRHALAQFKAMEIAQ